MDPHCRLQQSMFSEVEELESNSPSRLRHFHLTSSLGLPPIGRVEPNRDLRIGVLERGPWSFSHMTVFTREGNTQKELLNQAWLYTQRS